LFTVVIVLFGFMNVGAVVGFFVDTNERHETLARLQQADMGFAELDGAWTWQCAQTAMTRNVEAPAGSAKALSGVFGLPFVRLRAAIPEEAFAGSIGQAVGRKAGLSVQGLADASDDNVAASSSWRRRSPASAAPAPLLSRTARPPPRSASRRSRMRRRRASAEHPPTSLRAQRR
jgi:hypothetical protein